MEFQKIKQQMIEYTSDQNQQPEIHPISRNNESFLNTKLTRKPGYIKQGTLTKPGYIKQGTLAKPGYIKQGTLTKPGYIKQGALTKPGYIKQGTLTKPGYIKQGKLTTPGYIKQGTLTKDKERNKQKGRPFPVINKHRERDILFQVRRVAVTYSEAVQ